MHGRCSAKQDTERVAVATGSVIMEKATLDQIIAGRMKKGDVLGVAGSPGSWGRSARPISFRSAIR